MKMKTIGDVLKLCRANRRTYKNMTPEIKEEFQKLYKLTKTYVDTPIFECFYDMAIKVMQIEKMDIIRKTWAMEYLLKSATPHGHRYSPIVTKLVNEKLIKEKNNE